MHWKLKAGNWKLAAGSRKPATGSRKPAAGSWKLATGSWKPPAILLLACASAAAWLRCGPIPRELLDGVDTPSTVVVDRHGRVLYEALTKDGSRVKPIDAAALPPLLASATIAAEDRRFYSHAGV